MIMAVNRFVTVIIVAALAAQQCFCVPTGIGDKGESLYTLIADYVAEQQKATSTDPPADEGVPPESGTDETDEQKWRIGNNNRVICRPIRSLFVSDFGENYEYYYVRIDWKSTVQQNYVVHVAANQDDYLRHPAPENETNARHVICRAADAEDVPLVIEEFPSKHYLVHMLNITGLMNGKEDFRVRVTPNAGYKVYAGNIDYYIPPREHRITCRFDYPLPKHGGGGWILCVPSPPASTTASVSRRNVPVTTVPTVTVPTTTMPTTTMPTVTVPTRKMPTTEIPTETVLTTKMPTETVPTTKMPTQTVPTATMPTATMPTATMPTETMPTTTMPTVDGNNSFSFRAMAYPVNLAVEKRLICRMGGQIEQQGQEHPHYIVHMVNSTEPEPNAPRNGAARTFESHIYCQYTNRSDMHAADYKLYQMYMVRNNKDVYYGNRDQSLQQLITQP